MKKTILAIATAAVAIQALPAYAWSEGRCQVQPYETRAQKGKMLKHCVGKVSKKKYENLAVAYIRANGGVEAFEYMPENVQEVILRAATELNDETNKWNSEAKQKTIDGAKLAGTIAGSGAAVLASAAFLYGGYLLFTPPATPTIVHPASPAGSLTSSLATSWTYSPIM